MITLLVIINMLLAWTAALVSLYVSREVSGWLKWMLVAQSILALVYVAGYVWLLFNPNMTVIWSQTLRWVGIASWTVVWVAAPLAKLHYVRSHAKHLMRDAQRRVKDTQQKGDVE